MKLLPPAILQSIPALYATEHVPIAQKIVRAKLFAPWSSWSWYLIECENSGPIAWGLVIGHENEFGYFNLDELSAVRGIGGLTIERDRYFAPCTVAELIQRERIRISA